MNKITIFEDIIQEVLDSFMQKHGFICKTEILNYERICAGVYQRISLWDISSAGELRIYVYTTVPDININTNDQVNYLNDFQVSSFQLSSGSWYIYKDDKCFDKYKDKKEFTELLEDIIKHIKQLAFPYFSARNTVEKVIESNALRYTKNKILKKFEEKIDSMPFAEWKKEAKLMESKIDKDYKTYDEYKEYYHNAKNNMKHNLVKLSTKNPFCNNEKYSDSKVFSNNEIFEKLNILSIYMSIKGFYINYSLFCYEKHFKDNIYIRVYINRVFFIFFYITIKVERDDYSYSLYRDIDKNTYFFSIYSKIKDYDGYYFFGDKEYLEKFNKELIEQIDKVMIGLSASLSLEL